MDYRTIVLIALIVLSIVDALIPLPIVGLILIYVVMARPPWFSDLVSRVYGRAGG